MIDVEAELGHVVEQIGGVHTQALCGSSPNFNNADYVFDNAGVIAELKCLVKDHIADESTIDKFTSLYQEALNAGETGVVVYGRPTVRLGDFEDPLMTRMAELIRRPIKRAIEKANRQIKQTKVHLNRSEHRGLLILVNDSAASLEPMNVVWMLNRTLRDNMYKSINGVLFFAPNLPATDEDTKRRYVPWAECTRQGIEPCPASLLRDLGRAWRDWHARLTGEPVDWQESPPERLQELRNLPR